MAHRSTNVAFAVLVTMMLPIGAARAQSGAAVPPGTVGVGTPGGATGSGVTGSTTGIGNASGVNARPAGTAGAPSPPLIGQSSPPMAPAAVQGFAEQDQATSPTGLARTAEDGVSTTVVPARPCSRAAHETDGTTTCVGIPGRR
jgi:hypothetical protein